MQNITIGRCESDPTAQGVIRPADDSWQLVLDKDGYPVLYVRVKLGGEEGTGMLCIDDMLPPDVSTRDLMQGEFCEPVSAEDEAAAHAEHVARVERDGRPCPRE